MWTRSDNFMQLVEVMSAGVFDHSRDRPFRSHVCPDILHRPSAQPSANSLFIIGSELRAKLA